MNNRQPFEQSMNFADQPQPFNWLMVVTFVFFCFLLVGGTPFIDLRTDYAQVVDNAADGDAFRQILYLSILLVSFLPLLGRNIFSTFLGSIPTSLLVLCAWCLVTVVFAVSPSVSFRRWGLAIVIVMTVVNLLSTLGVALTLRVLSASIAFLIVVSVFSVPIIPGAVHPSTELDPELIGAWRGVFTHKNFAASVAAAGLVLHIHAFTHRRKMWILAIIVLEVIFLFGTRGKSALGLALPCAAIGYIYFFCFSRKSGRPVFLVFFSALVVFGSLFVFVFQDRIAAVLSDPTSFTGRVRIWQVAIAYVHEHPMFGAGFASYWQIGSASPIQRATSELWLLETAHSHDGYIEILLTTGVPGLLIAITAVILAPFYQFMMIGRKHAEIASLLFSIWTFGVLNNLTETYILARDKQVWVILLLAICGLKLLRSQEVRRIRFSRLNLREQLLARRLASVGATNK